MERKEENGKSLIYFFNSNFLRVNLCQRGRMTTSTTATTSTTMTTSTTVTQRRRWRRRQRRLELGLGTATLTLTMFKIRRTTWQKLILALLRLKRPLGWRQRHQPNIFIHNNNENINDYDNDKNNVNDNKTTSTTTTSTTTSTTTMATYQAEDFLTFALKNFLPLSHFPTSRLKYWIRQMFLPYLLALETRACTIFLYCQLKYY